MKVLFEDNHLIAVNKPVGTLSQGDITGDKSIIDEVKEYLKKKYKKPGEVFLGSIHRLDRVTSGILVFARTTKALTRMSALMKNREIKKSYLAILDNRPLEPQAKFTHYLRKNHKANYVTVSDDEKPETKKAVLSYELVAEIEHRSLVKIDIETGRPHQIRAQFSHMDCPITGDTKYGGSKQNNYRSGIYLHAYRLEFIHPVKKTSVRLNCKPVNSAMWKVFREFM